MIFDTVNESTFTQDLQLTLELEVDGTSQIIHTGHIDNVDLKLHSYGFEASVAFSTFGNDEMHALFAKEKVMNVSLTFTSVDLLKAGAPLLILKGIATKRNASALTTQPQKKQVRSYFVEFSDAAAVSWNNHYPFKIYVDQTMKDVIDAEKNPLISIKYAWDKLTQPSNIIALPINRRVSFYSFLIWYLHKDDGILEYGYKDHSYQILGKKKAEGKPIPINERWVSPALIQMPEPARYQERAVKHSADIVDNTDVDNPNGFQSVRYDEFDESSYRLHPEQVPFITHSKMAPQLPIIEFSIKEFTPILTLEQLLPGTLIEFKGDVLGAVWCDDTLIKGKTFRMTDCSFTAASLAPSEDSKKSIMPFRLQIRAFAESKDETFVFKPSFATPQYPFSIPGKIFCEIGDKEQTTFNVVKNDKAPLGQYLVKVPLAGEDKNVVVPFFPNFTSGQFYFPLCKDQQVLLSVYFQTAKIERILDWQPLTRLPLDTQANQIVFSSNGKDKFVVQKHEFKDGQDSILTIIQSSSPEQSQTIQIQEKQILITVVEKDKSTTTVQLNRDSGLTLQLKDESSGVTQQTIYDPTAISHTSEGSGGKTTIVQKPDSISIECKKFSLKCDEGIIEAAKTFTQNAQSKMFIKAPVVNILDTVKMGS